MKEGGPFEVDFRKPYKPVFICFVDIAIFVTFTFSSFLFFWSKRQVTDSFHEIKSFMPIQVIVFVLLFFFKFLFDVFYLVIVTSINNINRSKSTNGLFWARFKFDFFFFTIFSIINSNFYDNGKNTKLTSMERQEINMFRYFTIFKCLVEIILYFISVKPAYSRAIYQKHSIIRGDTYAWFKGGSIEDYERMKQRNALYEKHCMMRDLEEHEHRDSDKVISELRADLIKRTKKNRVSKNFK
jgi:hypothetical protein